MARICSGPDCSTEISKRNRSGRCSPCNLRHIHADPALKERHRVACKSRFADPDLRARQVERLHRAQDAYLADPSNRPAIIERAQHGLIYLLSSEAKRRSHETRSRRAFQGIPERRHDEVRQLARKMPAAEAKRIVIEDERIKAQREVRRIKAEMQARHERQKAQAW